MLQYTLGILAPDLQSTRKHLELPHETLMSWSGPVTLLMLLSVVVRYLSTPGSAASSEGCVLGLPLRLPSPWQRWPWAVWEGEYSGHTHHHSGLYGGWSSGEAARGWEEAQTLKFTFLRMTVKFYLPVFARNWFWRAVQAWCLKGQTSKMGRRICLMPGSPLTTTQRLRLSRRR